MRLMGTKQPKQSQPPKPRTPTFLLELPLHVEAGQTPACPPGSRASVLQCRARRRANAFAPHASRPCLASSASSSTHTTPGEAGRLLCPAHPVWLFRLCLSGLGQSPAGLLAGRPPRCRTGPAPGDLRRDPHKGKQAKHAQLALPHELDERANCWRKGGQQECVHRGEMIALIAHAIDEIGDEHRIDQGEQNPRPDRAPRQSWLIGGLHL